MGEGEPLQSMNVSTNKYEHNMSNEINPGWLEYKEDYTTQLSGDSNKLL